MSKDQHQMAKPKDLDRRADVVIEWIRSTMTKPMTLAEISAKRAEYGYPPFLPRAEEPSDQRTTPLLPAIMQCDGCGDEFGEDEPGAYFGHEICVCPRCDEESRARGIVNNGE